MISNFNTNGWCCGMKGEFPGYNNYTKGDTCIQGPYLTRDLNRYICL